MLLRRMYQRTEKKAESLLFWDSLFVGLLPICFVFLLGMWNCGGPVLPPTTEKLADGGQTGGENLLVDGGERTEQKVGSESELIAEVSRHETKIPETKIPVRKQIPGRGFILSSPRGGQILATSSMEQTMAETQKLGANWSGYHPYARISSDGSLRFSQSTNQIEVLKPMEFGKKLGMKLFLVPHIAYWGSKFSWRGAITFTNEGLWQRFFRDYQNWIVTMAKMAQAGGAQLFSVGIEYKLTTHREKEWRAIIAAVRKVYKGKLTYSANWDEYDKVPFWDALDFIGIQAYFPVAKNEDPPASEIRAGWKIVLKKLKAFSEKHKKSIILTELGYNHSSWAAVRPWDYTQGGTNAAAVKLRCMRVALEAIKPAKFLEAVFLWKWFPDGRTASHDFILQYPEMKDLVQKAWVNKGTIP